MHSYADTPCPKQPRMGLGLRGRDLVEPFRATGLALVGRDGRADAPSPEGGEQGRPRSEGSLVLRAQSARTGPDLAEVRRRPSGERHNTTQFLEWSCRTLKQMGKKALLLIWDNAS